METEKKIFDFSNRNYILVVIFLVSVLTFFSFRIFEIYNSATGNYPREITIDAVGKAFINPDTAVVNLGVHTEAKTTELATTENNDKMKKIFESIKALNIEDKDIKTTSYYLNQKYTWDEKKNKSIEDGYVLDQNITIKIRDLASVGEVISKATTAGANLVGGISFVIEDEESAKKDAREIAIQAANAKAKLISEQTGIKFGKIVNYYEYTDSYMPYANAVGGDMMSAYDSRELSAPTISPGQQEVSLRVSFTYRTK